MKVGDTIKFGRVRFKVIMLANSVDGEQVYQPFELVSHKKADGQNTVQDEEPSGESEEEGLDDDSEYYDEEEEAAHRRRLPTGSIRRARTGVT